ncbi:MAG TPA: hypothetical protein VJH69_01860 [Candidatus Paceibacterota bacterium]
MLFLYTGTDREKARGKMTADAKKIAGKKKAHIIRITDANTLDDFLAVLRGAGMFGEKRIILLEGILLNDEIRDAALSSLADMHSSSEDFFMFEERPLADIRRLLEKHADSSLRFEAARKKEATSIFTIANSLRRGDKKALWVNFQREITSGSAAEAIHGVLFWAAKDIFLKSRDGSKEKQRASTLVANLAELPHEARRDNFNLEYALERFILSIH